MKKISTIILFASTFLVSCVGGENDIVPPSTTVIEENEKENTSSNDIKAETLQDGIEQDSVGEKEVKTKTTLNNF